MTDDDLSRWLEHTWARQEARFAATLRRDDPSWGTDVFEVADGIAVLCGRGLFVNRALAVGLDAEVRAHQLDELEARARAVGVTPTVETTPVTRRSLVRLLRARRYLPTGSVSALVRPISDGDDCGTADPSVVIATVDDETLPAWQQATAEGWEHLEPRRRRASDAFARAAHLIDEPGLLIARAAGDDRVLACATLRLEDGLATLGGMSTRPPERRRGLHRSLVEHRLRLARDAGCGMAATVAMPDSASQRNLLRIGFRILHTKTTYELR